MKKRDKGIPPHHHQTDPSRMAQFFEIEAGSVGEWRPEELRSILDHQLSVPIVAEVCAEVPLTFAKLLAEPEPPLAALRSVKDYAKAVRAHPQSLLPRPVATCLYFAAIAAALVRRRTRLTNLDDAALRQGFQWALTQDWIEGPLGALFEQALSTLSRGA